MFSFFLFGLLFIEMMDFFKWKRFTTVIWFLFLLDQNSGCQSLEMIGLNTLIVIFGN